MSNEQPNYYAIIPANVRYADINSSAKLLYGEITALANATGYCYASNDYFAKLYKLKRKETVTDWIKILADHGFIRIEHDRKGVKIHKRKIYINPSNNDQQRKNVATNNEKTLLPTTKKRKENTTVNNTINSKSSSVDEQEVIKYLNNTIKSNDFKKSKDLRARLQQGYTVTQLKQVIYYCAITQHWLDKQEMFIYLRPSTLFRKSNFEKYYSEAKRMLKHSAKSSGVSKAAKRVSDEELYG